MKIEINNFEIEEKNIDELLELKQHKRNIIEIKINDKIIFKGFIKNIDTNLETLTGIDKLNNDFLNTNSLLDPVSRAMNFIIGGEK